MYVRSTKLEKTSLSFTNGLALNSSVASRLVLIKLLSANGDGEIRTLDPLLARQVLSQLSYTPIYCNQSAEQTDYLHAHQRVSFFRNLAPTCSPMPSPA